MTRLTTALIRCSRFRIRPASVCQNPTQCLLFVDLFQSDSFIFFILAVVHIEEVVGWSSPSQPAQDGVDLSEPLVRQLGGDFASVLTSIVRGPGGSLVDGLGVGESVELDFSAPRAVSSPRVPRSSLLASVAGQSARSTFARLPLSRGGLADPEPTSEPRSPDVPPAGKSFFVSLGRVHLCSVYLMSMFFCLLFLNI